MASKENIYFLRSFLLLVEGGLYISKEILSRECQKPENDLDELLKINERKLKHLFHGKQYKKLFPDSGKADINSWDLQLSVGVLINVFGSNLKAEKQKLRALRDLRNDIYMHCTTAALDEKKYEEVIEDLDDIITTLASSFDISVQQRCSNCIKQFTSGPLDAVRPSLHTLNGLSQSCQKKLKVGVKTELVIGGLSADWIRLCEHTLETILNEADSRASDGGGFQEIEENVKKMLSFLESNKEAVFKGCEKKCIVLYFECKDYESFLHFLYKVESQEYTSYLRALTNSLHSFFKPRCPTSITFKVTSESLQLILIEIIKTISNEEERRHVVEVSSEDNIHENKAVATASHGVNKDKQLINQSETSLFLNLELQSDEALPQMLQSFRGKQFSDSLKKVADSLSRHHGGEITIKASMDVGAMLEALEESVSSDVTVAKGTSTTGTTYEMALIDDLHSLPVSSAVTVAQETKTPKIIFIAMPSGAILHSLSVSSAVTVALETITTKSIYIAMPSGAISYSLSDEEKTFLADKIRIMKSVMFLREQYMLAGMMDVLSRKGLFTYQWEHFRINCKRKADIFISMVLTRPIELLKGFKQYLQDQGYGYIQRIIDSKSVTLKDITALSEQERSRTGRRLRQNIGELLPYFTYEQKRFLLEELENANDIAASLLSKMIISGNEFLKISLQPTRREGIKVLLDILEKRSENHLADFYSALKENGYNPSSEEFVGIKQEGNFLSSYHLPNYLHGGNDAYSSVHTPIDLIPTLGRNERPPISYLSQMPDYLPICMHSRNDADLLVYTPSSLRRTHSRYIPANISYVRQTSANICAHENLSYNTEPDYCTLL